jgi:Helix-turn-helix domain
MRKAGSVAAEDGRLAADLAATLHPKLQDALDHPVRREVLRTLNRFDRARTVSEIGAQLPFRLGQLGYHLQILRRSSVVSAEPAEAAAGTGRPRYVSQVSTDSAVCSVLRATESWDRERSEAVARETPSPLLTMFRIPRPVRTIRLRSRRKTDEDGEL